MQPSGEVEEEDNVAWVNAVLGRVFWDFLSEPHWADLVSKKIQMKLSKIRVSGARPLTTTVNLNRRTREKVKMASRVKKKKRSHAHLAAENNMCPGTHSIHTQR